MPALPAIGLSRHAPQAFPNIGGGIIEWDTIEWSINWPLPAMPTTNPTWPFTGTVLITWFLQPVQAHNGTYVSVLDYVTGIVGIEMDGQVPTGPIDLGINLAIRLAVKAGDRWQLSYSKANGTGTIILSDGLDHRSFMSAQYLETH